MVFSVRNNIKASSILARQLKNFTMKTEIELYKAMIQLAQDAEELGCGPIADDLLESADYLQEFINWGLFRKVNWKKLR